MKKLLTTVVTIILLTLSSNTWAQLAGKNVILVHGLIPSDINNNRSNSQFNR